MPVKKFLCLVCTLMVLRSAFCQQEVRSGDSTEGFDSSALLDATDGTDQQEKHYFVAVWGMVTVNLIIGGWNRFVGQQGWAQVTWDDVKEPWNRTVEFDRDWYWTNFVLHPYQGGLYYMVARGSGLDWGESLVVATAGSFMWEYFFEKNSPSINDMVYTPIGGLITGEILGRLSLEAQGRGMTWLSFAADPTRFFTTPVLGHTSAGYHPPSSPCGFLHHLSLWAGFGVSGSYSRYYSGDNTNSELFPVHMNVGMRVIYSDPYGHDSNTPYSHFELEMQGGAGVGSGEGANSTEGDMMYQVSIFSDGTFIARAPDWGVGRDTTVAIVMEWDFMWHSFMEFTSLGPGVAIKQRIRGNKGDTLWQLHLAWIALGTSDYYYLRRGVTAEPDYVASDYGYGTGAQVVSKLAWHSNAGLKADLALRGYFLWKPAGQAQEWNGSRVYQAGENYEGTYLWRRDAVTEHCDDWGADLFWYLQATLELPVSQKASLGIADDLFIKNGWYHNAGTDVFSLFNAVKFYARLTLL